MSEPTIENVLQKQLTVQYNGDDFVFKIPSMQDNLNILARANELRRDSTSDGNAISLGFDPAATTLTNQIATFRELLVSTSAKWVYTAGPKGPEMNLNNWPSDVPITEVVDKFNQELDTFRKEGNRSSE
jgi:hypothetical protein